MAFEYYLYQTLKGLHIFAMLAWMAGMLYLPRLFVYHAGVAPGSEASQLFKVMERRLYRQITTPAMIGTWLLGIGLLIINPGWLAGQGWLHAKLMLVLVLSAVHGFYGATVRRFANDSNRHSARFYRIINEVPALLALIVILLVALKPF